MSSHKTHPKKRHNAKNGAAGLEQCDNFELPQASLVARISSEILAPVLCEAKNQGAALYGIVRSTYGIITK